MDNRPPAAANQTVPTAEDTPFPIPQRVMLGENTLVSQLYSWRLPPTTYGGGGESVQPRAGLAAAAALLST